MNHHLKIMLMILPLTMLTACGGEAPTEENFTVNLDTVDVRLAGSGEVVTVDTAGVNSGTLTLKKNTATP